MADTNWAVCDRETGEVLGQIATAGAHPRWHGWPWNPDTQIAHMTDRQGDLSREAWDAEAQAWVPILEPLRAAKWAEAKACRDAIGMVAPTRFGPVQCDDGSRLNIWGLVRRAQAAAAAGDAFSEPFTLADNGTVTLTAETAIELDLAVCAYGSKVHAASQALRSQIFADDATVVGLEAMDIPAMYAAALAPAGGDEGQQE